MATGGGLLPHANPPKVPFELTDTVRQFAAIVGMKLAGLLSQGDSDAPSSSGNVVAPVSKSPPPTISEAFIASSAIEPIYDIFIESANGSSPLPLA